MSMPASQTTSKALLSGQSGVLTDPCPTLSDAHDIDVVVQSGSDPVRVPGCVLETLKECLGTKNCGKTKVEMIESLESLYIVNSLVCLPLRRSRDFSMTDRPVAWLPSSSLLTRLPNNKERLYKHPIALALNRVSPGCTS